MIKRHHIRFLRLYKPVHEDFERFCRVRAYGEMEPSDLVNESLLIAYEKLDRLESDRAFLSFLCGISIRVLANQHRKMKPETGAALENFATQTKTDQSIENYLLYEALAQLPIEQKEAIILFEISGFRIKEVAEIQGCSEDAVKQRLRRGRQRLTEILTFESKYKTGVES